VVQWHQRGAGKTFGKSGPIDPAVTIDRMTLDGVEVSEFLRRKLQKQKVFVLGHSWGTILGVEMAKARPDLFYAYVGTGQMVNQRDDRALACKQLLAEASARTDHRAIEELRANGPPPYDTVMKAAVHTKWANAYEPGTPSTPGLISIVLFESGYTFGDLIDYVNGITTSQNHFRHEVEKVDLPALGTRFAIVFFVFQGARDNVTPADPVIAYVDGIVAPQKQLVLIEGAGHGAMIARGDEFLRLLVQRVRPLATLHETANRRLSANRNIWTGPALRHKVARKRLDWRKLYIS